MRVVAIAGSSSNVGKTTLVCELLRRLPGWEAVKVTKGHYRSCGRDPGACCVSHLLTDRPLVSSDRAATDVAGKDTSRFWGAGAAGVHWVVATREHVIEGIADALSRVSPSAPGVLVEGTGFLRVLGVDLGVMAVGARPTELKPSAVRTFPHVDFLYAGGVPADDPAPGLALAALLEARGQALRIPPVLYDTDLDRLADLARSSAPRPRA
jgi:molybdopterin-guanine dinucleotide biosynthesis protein